MPSRRRRLNNCSRYDSETCCRALMVASATGPLSAPACRSARSIRALTAKRPLVLRCMCTPASLLESAGRAGNVGFETFRVNSKFGFFHFEKRDMNFKHLHYFWVAARAGGVVRAGEQLHVT